MPSVSAVIKTAPSVVSRFASLVEAHCRVTLNIVGVTPALYQERLVLPQLKPLNSSPRHLVLIIPAEQQHYRCTIDVLDNDEACDVHQKLGEQIAVLWSAAWNNQPVGKPATTPFFCTAPVTINDRQQAVLSAAKKHDRGKGAVRLRRKLCDKDRKVENLFEQLQKLGLLVTCNGRIFVNRQAPITVISTEQQLRQGRDLRRRNLTIPFVGNNKYADL